MKYVLRYKGVPNFLFISIAKHYRSRHIHSRASLLAVYLSNDS